MWLFLFVFRFLFATGGNTVVILALLSVSCCVTDVTAYLHLVVNKVVFPWNACTISVKRLLKHSIYNPTWIWWSLELHLSPTSWKQHSYVFAHDFLVMCLLYEFYSATTLWYLLYVGHLNLRSQVWTSDGKKDDSTTDLHLPPALTFAISHTSEARSHQIPISLFSHWKLYWRT
jgi:hypothetical protein